MSLKEVKEKYDLKDLESEIKKISVAAKALLGSQLKIRTIALLIKDQFKGAGPRLADIQAVLEIAAELEDRHFKTP